MGHKMPCHWPGFHRAEGPSIHRTDHATTVAARDLVMSMMPKRASYCCIMEFSNNDSHFAAKGLKITREFSFICIYQ